MPEHSVAALQHRGRRLPPGAQPRPEEFVGVGLAAPHGNCRDPAQSGRVINQHQTIAPRDDYVMRKLVLHDDARDNPRGEDTRRVRRRPPHHVVEILLPRQFPLDIVELLWGQTGVIYNTHVRFF